MELELIEINRGDNSYLYQDKLSDIQEGDWVYNLTSLPNDPLIHKVTNINSTYLSIMDSLHARKLNSGCRNFKSSYRKILISSDPILLSDSDYILSYKQWFREERLNKLLDA